MSTDFPLSAPPIDPVLLDELTADLAAGRTDTVGALFSDQGAARPTVLWRPGLVDVQHPILRSFLRSSGGADGGPVPVSWIESEEFAALADWAMILEPCDDGRDFVYRHYGSQIALSYRKDMQGLRASDIGGHVALFFLALYRAAARRREIVKSTHEPPRQVFVRAWRRLVVPLEDEAGRIQGFAVANVPDNDLRAGLEVIPDAVLVVDAEGGLCYANRAACLLFEQGRGPKPGVTLQEFTGMEPDLPGSPQDLILEGKLRRELHMVKRGGVPTAMRVTCGATYYRDMPFFILTVRAD